MVHGTLKGAIVFHKKSVKDSMEKGFKLSPHDTCIVNGDASGKQQTVTFHIDNMKGSHMDPEANTKAIECP